MNLAGYIDHTLLKPDCTPDAIGQLCREAMQHHFAAVCLPPFYVSTALKMMEDEAIRPQIATVIGFPMGYSATPAKVEEIKKAIDDGADEVDAVINHCALKSGNWNYVQNDIDSTTTAARLRGKKIKITLETNFLSAEEIQRLAEILRIVAPDFIKVSTGFYGNTPTPETVQLLNSLLGDKMAVAAFGDIQTKAAALALVEAGAHRIGTFSGMGIIMEG